MALSEQQRVEVDQWFLDRGVPHLMVDYTAADDIFTRMFRFLVLIIFAELFLTFSDDFDGWAQAALFGAGAVILFGAISIVNKVRGRRWNQVPDHVGPLELSVFVLVPSLLRAFSTDNFGDFWQWACINLAILGVGYLITSYGLLPMIPWALRQVRRQLADMANLFAKSLPLLLLFSAFLFVNAEIWQVASEIPFVFFFGVVGFIVSIGLLFVVLGLRHQLDDLNVFSQWSEVADLCEQSPIRGLVEPVTPPSPRPPPLRRRERFNLGLLMLVAQSIQILLVAVMVGVFYIIFGLFTVGETTILQWTTMTPETFDPIATYSLFGSEVVLTWTLLVVSGFIAAFSGLQFAVSLVNDETYRNEFSNDLRTELRGMLAVRCAAVTLAAE